MPVPQASKSGRYVYTTNEWQQPQMDRCCPGEHHTLEHTWPTQEDPVVIHTDSRSALQALQQTQARDSVHLFTNSLTHTKCLTP